MKRKKSSCCLLLLILIPLSGCSMLNGSVPFRYVPSLNTVPRTGAVLGMEKFVDSRPAGDREATDYIPDIDEKITAKVLDDLQSSRIFADIEIPARREADDLILKGEIKRFYWKTTHNPVKFIPFVNMLMLLGIPSEHVEAVTELKITLTDAKTNAVVGKYDKIATRTDRATMYTTRFGESGAELAETFREVMKQIKGDFAADIRTGKIRLPGIANR